MLDFRASRKLNTCCNIMTYEVFGDQVLPGVSVETRPVKQLVLMYHSLINPLLLSCFWLCDKKCISILISFSSYCKKFTLGDAT